MSQAIVAHDAFDPIRGERIDSLNLEVQQFEHRATGAMHYHLAADNTENVFLVALRTVPEDSTGVAHILEHTALCGSERFPVRDPFFLMLRRSLNTFMNAFTSSDWTAYPFASQNRKDFNNLLEVYLDAVFFSRLDPLDFAQEGHRVEFADPADPDSELVFKGVVFNEMKGAMSAVTSSLWQALCHHLFPTTTYHYNSGGEPRCIPDLSYDRLTEFYRTHYHPGNAIFMTFGDVPAHEHQAVFQERALSRFDRLEHRIAVPLERRMKSPRRVEESYAFDDGDSGENKTHIVMGWLLGESSDPERMLEARLLSSVLLDNSASPLLKVLETTELGHAPSSLCGLEESMREMVLVCGLEGSEAEHADALEELVLEVLEQVSREGVPEEKLEAVLYQLELHQREISGDGYPYGLQLILTALGCATHYADPIAALNPDPALARIRERVADPDYIRGLARRLLLDNPHRVTLVMSPDRELSARRHKAEKERLGQIRDNFTGADIERVRRETAALAERQAGADDESILPKVELADVPRDIPNLYPRTPLEGFPCTAYGQGTNGLVYQQALMPLPALGEKALQKLAYYTGLLTELGLGESDYLSVQDRQAATVGSINTFTSMRGTTEDRQVVKAFTVLSSKALVRNRRAQAELMHDTLETARFDEHDRIRELVSQQRARREQAVTENGHGLAMAAACAGTSPLARLNHRLSGLEGIRNCKRLDDALDDSEALESFAAELQSVHREISAMPRQYLLIAEEKHLEEAVADCAEVWGARGPASDHLAYRGEPVSERSREIWLTNTQVNFCARAYPTVPVGHEDAAALTALGGFLRNGYLHTAIRERGGAYGGGASQDSSIGAFRFFSYRDPRLLDTLADFDRAIDWMLETRHRYDALEQAILGVIGNLDKPGSPAGEAKQHYHNNLFGRTHAQREEFRRRVLALELDDLRRVATSYLRPQSASTAVITNKANFEAVSGELEGMAVEEL